MSETGATPSATLGNVEISLPQFLHYLQRRGRLPSLLGEAIIEEFLVQVAKQAELTVTTEALQRTADLARRRHGLTSAAQTHDGLGRQGLSVVDFEDALERDLLIDKLKDHLVKDRIAAHFEQHRTAYDCLRLRQVTAPREDLARELLSQIQDEGQDFAELVQQQQANSSVVVYRRRQLHPPIAVALPNKVGGVAGPVATPKGFVLVRVEAIQPAQLDAATAALIRQELFEAWLREQLAQRPLRFPLLDELT